MNISIKAKVLIKFGTPEMMCVELRAKKKKKSIICYVRILLYQNSPSEVYINLIQKHATN